MHEKKDEEKDFKKIYHDADAVIEKEPFKLYNELLGILTLYTNLLSLNT